MSEIENHVEDHTQARSGVSSTASSKKWRPMATAPKDGGLVLLYRKGFNDPYRVGCWVDGWGEWQTVPGFYSLSSATHWMPLPPPPESAP